MRAKLKPTQVKSYKPQHDGIDQLEQLNTQT